MSSTDEGVRTLVLCEGDHRDGPYGVDRLESLGFTLTGVQPRRGRVLGKVRDVVEHRSGVRVDEAVTAVPLARRADLVLGVFEPRSEFALHLRGRGLPPYAGRPFVFLACWLTEWLRGATPERRAALVRCYGAADLVVVLSNHQIPELLAAGFDPERLAVIPYGCAVELFAGPPRERDLDVVAAGFDRGRDYATFFDGVRDRDVTVHVLCQKSNLDGLDVPSNVVVHDVLPYDEYRQVMRRAKVVAVPTREVGYPCGQSVALDAAAAGAVVAFSDTVALGEYLDDSCAAPVAVGDAAGWGATLTALLADDARRESLAACGHQRVVENFTVDHMWRAFKDRVVAHGLVPGGEDTGARIAFPER